MSKLARIWDGVRRIAAHARERLGWLELPTLVAVAAIIGGLWVFVELADEVLENDTHAVDRAILLAMRNPDDPADPLGPVWFEELARDITALGGAAVLALATIGAAGFAWLHNRWREGVVLVLAVSGGALATHALKLAFARARPDLVPHGTTVLTLSFPSGHAMISMATYLLLGVLLARTQRRRRQKIYVLGWGVAMALLIGASRVYLGVHWPTDVLASWTLGAAWAMFCWLIAFRWLGPEPQARPPE